VKYGVFETDLHRYTWDKTKELRTATGVSDSYISYYL
jgi:hypothetical protein